MEALSFATTAAFSGSARVGQTPAANVSSGSVAPCGTGTHGIVACATAGDSAGGQDIALGTSSVTGASASGFRFRSPSARRLHWRSIPQKDGVTIEFASVAGHDEYSIPV